MNRRGLLLTITEPPPAMEEEFNAWYDEEHLPERLAIPGFVSARRWVLTNGAPGEGKYLATYELESPGVLESAAYLEKFNHQTPWSRRCLGKCVVFRRWACEQRLPGDADPDPAARLLVLLVGDRPTDAGNVGEGKVRHFFAPVGKEPAHVALVELPHERALSRAGSLAERGRVYRAYG